jgi:hypothetical protein
MTGIRTLLPLCFLAAGASAHADESPAQRLQMIIWAGGDTRAEADALLEDYKARIAVDDVEYHELLQTIAPYPQVLESAKVAGLAPGFFIVALGTCRDDAARALVKRLAPLEPGVYARSIDSKAAPDCPTDGGWDSPRFAKARVANGLALTAVVFTRGQGSSEGNSEDGRCTLRLALRDAGGQLLAHDSDDPKRCLFASLRARKDGIVVRYEYSSQVCTGDERSEDAVRYFVEDGRIASKLLSSRITRKMYCD